MIIHCYSGTKIQLDALYFYLLDLENLEKAYVVSKYERLEWQTKDNSNPNLKAIFPVGDSLKIKMFLNYSF